MARVVYVGHDGSRREIELEAGLTVMEGAVNNGIPGIDADCGGVCACATCHVYVDPAWLAVVGEAGDQEADMLELAQDVRSNSRLACQIKITDAMDGFTLVMPESQY